MSPRRESVSLLLNHPSQVSLFCARQSTDGFLSAAERQLILYDIVTRIRTEVPVTVGGIKFYQHESIVSGLISNNVIKQVSDVIKQMSDVIKQVNRRLSNFLICLRI